MLTLFYKPTCPFCHRVLAAAEDLGVKFNLRDIVSDPAAREELADRGGKVQVPYLVDPERNVEMYESEDIVTYLETNYATGSAPTSFGGVRIHQSEEICDSCQ